MSAVAPASRTWMSRLHRHAATRDSLPESPEIVCGAAHSGCSCGVSPQTERGRYGEEGEKDVEEKSKKEEVGIHVGIFVGIHGPGQMELLSGPYAFSRALYVQKPPYRAFRSSLVPECAPPTVSVAAIAGYQFGFRVCDVSMALPAVIVAITLMSLIVLRPTSCGSLSRTTKSAYLPASMLPMRSLTPSV